MNNEKLVEDFQKVSRGRPVIKIWLNDRELEDANMRAWSSVASECLMRSGLECRYYKPSTPDQQEMVASLVYYKEYCK